MVGKGCIFKAFPIFESPKTYDGKGGVIVLTRLDREVVKLWIDIVVVRKEIKGEAAMAMTWNDFKALMLEEFCPSNEMEKLENEFWNHKMVGANHAAYTDSFEFMSCSQLSVVATLTKGSDKRRGVEESSKTGGSWKDNKKAKTGTGFVATAPPRNEIASSSSKDCRAPVRQVAPVNAVRMIGIQLALEGYSRKYRSNGTKLGKSFNVNVNAMEGGSRITNVVIGLRVLSDDLLLGKVNVLMEIRWQLWKPIEKKTLILGTAEVGIRGALDSAMKFRVTPSWVEGDSRCGCVLLS
ncbi:hypothetical protein Tco_1522988 [Tanacetum coccineum]